MNSPDSIDLNCLSAWQYNLPDDLIASRPAAQRDEARLMVVRRESSAIEHHAIRDLPDLLSPGDHLVFNNTKVLPARLFGFRTSTGGRWEGLFLNAQPDGLWKITGQTRGKLRAGESITIVPASAEPKPGEAAARDDNQLLLEMMERTNDGSWLVRPHRKEPPEQLLEEFGTLPLPPYIGRKVADDQDRERYQTTFAQQAGAIAAPTAGLHFTPELLNRCSQRGIHRSEVTLHVGIGTFRPVNTDRLSEHEMHSEWCSVSPDVAQQIQQSQGQGGNVVAVGTTSVRTLEAHSASGQLQAGSTDTELFIRPGYRFQTVDQLLTNFHLPGSTLIVLVAALAGYDLTMEAYRTAVAERYRFYSYGDAMLIL
ncbi:MAG: tRNA preQ1(34) S-adenosylmethionine ribosyltransferase-isomerase QueA [Fuerstiella sp.]